MDKDLIAYLEERFRESAQQLAGFREETDRRFGENSQQLASFREENTQRLASLGEEAARQLASFREENTRRLASLGEEAAQQLASFREEAERRFEEAERRFEETNHRMEQVEDGVRYTQIMVEGVRGDVQLLAEGVAAFDGKLAAHRIEFKEEIKEVKALLHLSYGDLNRRIG
jgi:DNA anti-recombination protein RmuC